MYDINKKARQLARLIILSGPNLFEYIYKKTGQDLEDFILYSICNSGSPLYYKNIIDISHEESVRGMILVLPGKEIKDKSKNEIGLFRKFHVNTWEFLKYTLKIIWRMRVMLYYPKIMDDEWFISNLAVFEQYQNNGIASELLNKAEARVRASSGSKISLFVELDNERAISLYTKCGYEILSTHKFPQNYNKYQLDGFYKMIKNIK